MTTTIKKTVFVSVTPNEYDKDGWSYCYTEHSMECFENYSHLGQVEISIELPEGLDINIALAGILDKQKTEIMATAQAKITQIESQKQKLLALECQA